MKKFLTFKNLLILFALLGGIASVAQVKEPFVIRWNNDNKSLRGDMLLIGNNIVSRSKTAAYTGSTANDQSTMVMVDIDNDNTTRNSSSARLNIPNINCSDIEYAGLYWSATYRYETANDPASSRFEDWNTIKFKVPGGNYVNLTADDVMYNAFADPIQTDVTHGPYSCYKNVTTLLKAIALPNTANGDYFVGNIRVSLGGNGSGVNNILGGVSGGWSLVVVYKNSSLPSKSINTFDGHAVIKTGLPTPLEIHVGGFKTRPFPEPVNSRIGVVGLEGDFGLNGDQLNIKSDNVPTNVPPFVAAGFTNLSNPGFTGTGTPPPLNYFNSSISLNGTALNAITDRNPNSKNTLGWDQHLNRIIQNTNLATPPINPIIPNNCEGVTLQLRTALDKYDVFFASFDVEVIAPEIPLTKTVNNLSFVPSLNNATLSLGQEFYYGLSFENIGNDNATNVVITDVLPQNIVFPSVGTIINPTDVLWNGSPMPATWYTYNFTTKTFVFTFPASVNNQFLLGGNLTDNITNKIFIKVRSPLTCNDVVDACSNIVVNQAFITYKGDVNQEFISDPVPSGNGTSICRLPTPGATNYLLDVTLCDYTKTEILCGTTLQLTAPNGYSSYTWTNSSGVQIGTNQTITVTSAGVYQVLLTTDNPCKSITQTITVINFNGNVPLPNPVIPFASEVVTCTNNGIILPKIYLCGNSDFKFIQTGITGATNIVWEKLVACGSPTNLPLLCPNTSTTCTWTNVGTGANFTANTAGEYRITVFYQNGCFREYYFNVYKNVLNPTIVPIDIVCTTPGSITVTNIPIGYEYSLTATGPFSINPVLPVTIAGNYTVYIRQIGITGACLFNFPFITINDKQISVAILKTDKICNNGFGSIKVQINNVNPQYTYQLSQGATILQTIGPINANDYTFQNLNPGTYTVTSTTNQGCLDVKTVIIENLSNLLLTASVSQNITCTQGNIQLNPSGGQTPYSFAIYSYNGTVVNPADYVFQSSVIFDVQIGQQGTYQYVMVDNNNCSTLSNPILINLEPPIAFSEVHTNVTCNGYNNGSITMSTGALNGYSVTYSINGIDFQTSNVFSPLPPGNYTITIKFQKGNRECDYTIEVPITQPDLLTGASQLVQQKTCLVNGSIQAINVTGGTTPYQYSINGTAFQNSNVFPNLQPGSYTIIIRDNNLCTYTTLTQIIQDAIAPTGLNITNTAITCPSLTTSIIASVVGGTGAFTYQIISPSIINPSSTTLTNATFTGLTSGQNYTIKVTDSKGCTYQTNKFINLVTPITLNGNVTSNVTCLNTSTGSATYNVSGFNTTYSYTLNNGTPILNQTSSTIVLSNLAAGSYTIVVTDNQTNCSSLPVTLNVLAPVALLQLSNTITPITCISNGSLNSSATGGWGSYQYTLTQPDGTILGPQNTGVFGNLSQTGTFYTIKVKDANNCEVSNTFVLLGTTNPTLSISASSDLCFDATNGASITVTASGGTPNYQYQNNTGALQNSPIFNNLIPGSYTIKVIDSYGCEATVTQVINPALTAQAVLTKALDCSITPAATINVTINGGLAAYQYQINFNNGGFGTLNNVTTNPISYSTLIPGTYQFKIIDSKGCFFITSIQVPSISNPNITSITQTPPDCNGGNNGTLTVNVDPLLGTGPFMYNINNGTYQVSPIFTGYSAGNYTIGVKDFKGCLDSDTVVLLQPSLLLGQSQLVQQITCLVTTGTIQAINVSGGNGGYQYSINGIDFQSTPVFAGLAAGDYTIIIRDSKNCSITTAMITLTVPAPLTDIVLTSSTVSCPNLSTSIEATAVGGLAPYTYQIISPSLANPSTVNGNTVTFDNLLISATTTYIVKVIDSNGCFYEKNITVPNINKIAVVGVVNNGVSCLNDTNGQVTFTVSGFSSNYSYTINNGTVSVFSNPSIVLTGLSAGNYEIKVTDLVTNCIEDFTVTVPAPQSLLLLNAPITQPTCSTSGSVNANATGGWGTYEYSLVYPSGTIVTQNSGLFSGLLPNVLPYTIKVKDLNGCEKMQAFVLVPYINPDITIDSVNSDFCYDATNAASINVSTTSGVPTYQYQIKLGSNPYGSLQSSNLFANLSPGTYTIKVIDSNGCFDEITQIIAPQLLSEIEITKNLDCSSSPAATISIAASGGITPYQFQIKFNSDPYSALALLTSNPLNYSTALAGNYQIRIVDAIGCVFTSNIVTINPLVNPEITSISQLTNLLCFGDATASIEVNPNTSVGLSPYQYSLDGITFQNSTTFSSLSSGIYTVTIKDANECINTKTITINEPSAIDFTVTKTDLICSGIPGGGNIPATITISGVNGGTPAYSYILKNVTFQVIATFNPITNEDYTFMAPDVDFGIYNVEVVDANGCSKSFSVTIASPPNSLIATNATVSCLTGATVDVTVLAAIPSANYVFGILTQSTSPYSLSFQPPNLIGGTVSTFTNLVPGQSYTFVVRDLTTNCYFIQDVSTQIPPTSLVAINNIVSQNVTCFGSSNGNISFDLTNFAVGTTSVNYEVFQSITNTSFGFGNQLVSSPLSVISVTNFATLPAGNYYFLITESGGCTTTRNFTITESNQLLEVNANFVENDNCNTPAGIISAYGQFGTPPYQFEILPNTATAPTVLTWVSSGSSPFTVASGTYVVYVKDANNCIQASNPVFVGLDPIPVINLALNNPCVTENNFEITVTRDPGTIEPYTYSVDNGLAFTNNSLSFVIPNLSSGLHTVKVTDGNGCSELVTDQITIIPNAIISAPIKVQPSCAIIPDGEIHVIATNGSGDYTYTINTTPTPTSNISGDFLGLVPGSYTITIKDNISTCDYFVTTTIEIPTPVDFSLIKQDPTCNGATNGVIEVILNPLNSSNPDYTYTLTAPGFITVVQIGNPVFNIPLGDNNYQVTVQSGRGCEKTLPINLIHPGPLSANDTNSYSFVCNNNVASSITLNGLVVSGGTLPYSYSIDNSFFQNTPVFVITDTGLPQNITIYVKDAKGCTTSFAYNITPLATMSNPVVVKNILLSCIDDENITISFTGNASANYTYQLLPSTTTTPFMGTSFTTTLPNTGQFTFQINDVSGCNILVNHIVLPYANSVLMAQPTQNIDCFNVAIGQFEFSVTNYSGSIDYEIYGFPLNNLVFTATNALAPFSSPATLAAGSYYVKIKEIAFPFCELTSGVITINSPAEALSVTLTQTNDRDCLSDIGTITATAIGGTAPYAFELSNAGGVVQAFSSDYYFENYNAGSYSVNVIDAKGCTTSATITIGLNPKPLIDIALLNPCALDGQYEIEVTRTQNGIAPYYYEIDGNDPILQNTTPFTIPNLLSGLHSVIITDANGCGEQKQLTITPKAIASVTIVSQPSCTVGGSIITNVSGGTGPFSYSLQNSAGVTILTSVNGVFSDPLLVPALNYSVTITDANLNGLNSNCTTVVNFDLEAPTPVTFSLVTTQPSCNNTTSVINNGSINVVLAPGNNDSPYTYTLTDGINPPIVQTNPLFAGLAGSSTGILYTVRVSSERECFDTQTTTLINTIPINVATIVPGVFDCDTNTTLNITVPTPTGGTPPYVYSFNGSNFSSINTLEIVDTGLIQDIIITVKDDKTCETTQTVRFLPLNNFTVSTTVLNNLSCSNSETITLTITGTSTYTYQLLPSGAVMPVASNNIIPLSFTESGNYIYKIIDTATGCFKIIEYNIAALPLFIVTATPGNPLNCYGDTNGTLSFVVNGYTGNFTFDVIREDGTIQSSGTNATTNVTGLTIGNYSVNVTIPNTSTYVSCSAISNVITIVSPPSAIQLNINQTSNVTCNNNAGTILAIGSGGTLPYQYQLEKMPLGVIEVAFGNQSSFTGLPAGDYKVKIKDANNCNTEQLITLLPTTTITVVNAPSITNQLLKCYNDTNASVTITGVSGGQGSYQYELTNLDTNITSGPLPNATFIGLGVGNYNILVTDGWGCSSAAIPFAITQPTEIIATLQTLSGATCLTSAVIKISATQGTPPYQYSIDNITYNTTDTFTVGPGTYQYYVTDANNCRTFITNEVIINPVSPLDFDLVLNNIVLNCANDNNASVLATGLFGLGNYSYSLLNATTLVVIEGPQTNGLFDNLGVGDYIVRVTSGDCVLDKTFSVSKLQLLC